MLAVLIAGGALPLRAQTLGPQTRDPLAFRRFSIAEGLSTYEITALHQESGNGPLWVGTLDGLHRFDGYGFEVYRREEGLSDNAINYGALYERDGALWIGTRRGLNRLDLETNRITHYLHDPSDATTLSDGTVTSIAPAGPQALWVGTRRGLNRLNLVTGHSTRYAHDPARPQSLCADLVTWLYVAPGDTLWIGSAAGLCRYDAPSDEFVRYSLNGTPAPLNGRPDPLNGAPAGQATPVYVSQITPARDGQLWLGTLGRGVLRFDPRQERVTAAYRPDPAVPGSLPDDQVPTLMEDEEGLWVGTWQHGLCLRARGSAVFSCETNRLEDPASLSNNYISALLRDAAGNLFVGTWEGLSQRAVRKRFTTYGYRRGDGTPQLSHPRVNAVYEDDEGILWIGTLGGGLNRLDRSTGLVTYFRHDPDDPASLAQDRVWSITGHGQDLWVATEAAGISRLRHGGLTRDRLGRGRAQFVHFRHDPALPRSLGSDLVHTVYQDEEGTLWVGTATDGLFRYDPQDSASPQGGASVQDGGFTAYSSIPGDTTSLAHAMVWPLLASGGHLWVGTFGGGLSRLDRRSGRFTHYRHEASDSLSLGSDKILHLSAAPSGSLWIGTAGGGLSRYDPVTGQFRRFTTKDGLPHENAACVLATDDEVWTGTTNGLARLDLRSGTFTRYGTADGLPSTTFMTGACARGRGGEFFFGTAEGLVVFRPEEIRESAFEPRVVLTGFEVFEEPLALDTSIARLHRITLPYDRNFVNIHFSSLDFTAPAQNAYRYRLEGLDPGWVDAGTRRVARYTGLHPGTYTLRVQGTNSDGRWSSHEAKLQLVIVPPFWQTWWFALLVGALIGALLFAAHRFRVYHLMEAERVRRRIASDLHDDLGSEVTSLAFSLEREARSPLHELPQRERLSDLSQRAHRVTAALREATWLVDARNDTLVDLVDRLHEITFQIVADGRATFEAPPELPLVRVTMERRQHICLICKEALTNVIRHAGARAVKVRVDFDGRVLIVQVADDGAGFSAEELKRVSGMDNMRSRAKLIGARLHIESSAGRGTLVRLVVTMT